MTTLVIEREWRDDHCWNAFGRVPRQLDQQPIGDNTARSGREGGRNRSKFRRSPSSLLAIHGSRIDASARHKSRTPAETYAASAEGLTTILAPNLQGPARGRAPLYV